MKAIKEHWLDIIMKSFSKDAGVYLHDIEEFCLDVDWKLKNDPTRPNKRSKKLRIIISIENLDDYRDANSGAKNGFDDKLLTFVEKTLAQFDPDHDAPYDRTPPVETVHVPFGVTN
jgi:hypothetical protein